MEDRCLSQIPEEPEVPPIESWTQVPEDHQEIDLKTPCMGCHDLKVDATTTATKQMVRIGKKLDKEILWERITEYLGNGRETRTMVMATALNNIPLTTTCDQMLDPRAKVLYAFYEVGTEKLNHLKENAYVSLQWHKPWENDFSKVLCVQVRGRARLFDGTSSEMKKGIQIYFPLLPDENRNELLARVEKNMVMSVVTIDQVVLFDGVLLTQGLSSYQMWRRNDTFNPSYYTTQPSLSTSKLFDK
jgi:hypothetical protein